MTFWSDKNVENSSLPSSYRGLYFLGARIRGNLVEITTTRETSFSSKILKNWSVKYLYNDPKRNILLVVQKASEKATAGSSYGELYFSVGTILFHRYQPRGFVDMLRPTTQWTPNQ